MVPVPTLDELAAYPERAKDLPTTAAQALLARVAAILPLLLARALAVDTNGHAATSEDHLLSASEAAKRLGVSTDWVYRRAKSLPFTVRLGSQVRFSSLGIERYIKTRQGR